MPKESIFSSDGPFGIMEDGSEVPAGQLAPEEGHIIYDRAVAVAWSRASENRDGNVEVGAELLTTADGSREDWLFLSLDRAGINRLIQTLRRARDQAFGADA